MEHSRAIQSGEGGPIAGPSMYPSVPAVPQAHGVTTHQGDVNLAGHDVNVHHHYHSYPDKVDIGAVLSAIRNMRVIHSDNLSKATPGTGVWFFKTKMFLMWVDLNGDLKILWGTGIPGAGKTILSSIVIQEMQARAAVQGSQICVCYVYCRYSDSAGLTVRDVLEILVKQTVERHSECAVIAERAYARHVREKTQPMESELLQLLHQFTETVAVTFYFLDALDEAPDRIQVDLVGKLASLNVRLFITSRPLEAVQAQFLDAHRFPIAAQDADLDLRINQEIARSQHLSTLLAKAGSSLRTEIVSMIKRKCGGMFLHASLQLDELGECISAGEVREALEAFPSNIEDVYLRTWNRILAQKAKHVSTAKSFLVWVLNAEEPMTIEALERAVAISPDTQKFEPDQAVPRATLIALCRGLVTLEEESRIVRLVHYTAQDTLRKFLHNSFPNPHIPLLNVCLSHLTECGFQNTAIRSEKEFDLALDADPLLAYASRHWATHARQPIEDASIDRLSKFVRDSTAFPAFTDPDGNFDTLSPVHILALYDLPISLIRRGDVVNPNALTHIEKQSALTFASGRGNETVASFLLAHDNVQINLQDRWKCSALILAAENGHEGIVKLLLAYPKIQVNLLDEDERSALIVAAQKGHEGVVKLLLAHPEIQVNLQDRSECSALICAAENGQEGIVKLLLARPEIQVNLQDWSECSALIRAAENGHEGIVKLLLAHPEIQVNLQDWRKSSALIRAAQIGYEGIVKLLLAHPEIQVNLQDRSECSALIRAAQIGYEGIVKLLLAHPEIQVNPREGEEWSVLIQAAQNGDEGIVKLLLARPEIHVNLVDRDEWRSALTWAAENGREDIVQFLLAHPEIETTNRDAEGNTAISLALARGRTGIVHLLQDFESRRARSNPHGMTLGHSLHLGSSAVGESVAQAVEGGGALEECLAGDGMMDGDEDGTEDEHSQKGISGSTLNAKRSRDDYDEGGLLDVGIGPPASKRRHMADPS